MSVLEKIQDVLSKTIQSEKMFVYDGEYLQAVAFFEGKNSENIKKAKESVRKSGFKYNFLYGCYMKKPDPSLNLNGAYRNEKDNFIEEIIKWKLSC